jgi:hypothetical protein
MDFSFFFSFGGVGGLSSGDLQTMDDAAFPDPWITMPGGCLYTLFFHLF